MERFAALIIFALLSIFQGISHASRVQDCVTSCKGLATGDYPSCLGCEYYVTCAYGNLIGPRHCPPGTVYDARMKRCDHSWNVPDCKIEATESPAVEMDAADCTTSCQGLDNGFYQHCDSCDQFVQCNKGVLYTLSCPAHLKWNNKEKLCDTESSTCPQHKPMATSTPASSTTKPSKPFNSKCIDSCVGIPLGNYQSCYTCSMYVSCAPGSYTILRPCPAGLVWDDEKKVCNWSSPTCDPDDLRTTSAPATTESEPSSGDGEIPDHMGSW